MRELNFNAWRDFACLNWAWQDEILYYGWQPMVLKRPTNSRRMAMFGTGCGYAHDRDPHETYTIAKQQPNQSEVVRRLAGVLEDGWKSAAPGRLRSKQK